MNKAIWAACLTLSMPVAGWSITNYAATDIGSLGGGNTSALAINDLGQIVGTSKTSSGQADAFLYTGGVMIDLGGKAGWSQVTPLAINNLGQIVGTYNGGAGSFLFAAGVFTDLGNPLGGRQSQATGINNLGQITGWSQIPDLRIRTYIRSGGTTTDLGTDGAFASGINDGGQVSGDYFKSGSTVLSGFIYSGGMLQDIGNLGGIGVGGTSATAINASGHATGYSTLPNTLYQHPFLYSGGVMVDLGALYGNQGIGFGLNNLDEVVGQTDNHAFLYSQAKLYDVNTLLATSIGTSLSNAVGINNTSRIISNSVDGRSFLLTPTAAPEPGTFALFGLAALGLLRLRNASRRAIV